MFSKKSSNTNRRKFIQNIAIVGASGLAATTFASPLASTEAAAAPLQPDEFIPVNPKPTGKLTVKQVLAMAEEQMSPDCQMCRDCDGRSCAGEFFGGVGSGSSFKNNFTALQRIRLNMNTLVDEPLKSRKPDTSTTIFGQKLSFPAIAAPVGPVILKLGKGIEKDKYFEAVMGGCFDAGIAGSIGDNPKLTVDDFKHHCDYIAAVNGKALMGLKPRLAKDMIPLLPYVEQAGTFMICIDTDSGGLYPTADLLKITKSTKIPVVVKGVMTLEDAKRALDAGAKGIIVSNHGGRRLDYTKGTAEVLPEIADAMKGDMTIFVDGCVRYGADVLKYIALGADAVLVGRHVIKGAFGGGREGVALLMNTMREELVSSMSLTGVTSIDKISRKIISI